MSAQLYALGRWCFRHAKLVLASWLVIVLAMGGAALAFGGGFADVFKIPGSPSQVALDKLQMTFPQGAMTQASAIFVAPESGRVEDFRGVIEDTITELEAIDFVDSATSPWDERISGMVSDDGRAAIVSILIDVNGTLSNEQLAQLTAVAERMSQRLPQGATLDMGGQAFNIELPRLSVTEITGLGVALVVLTLVLGSLVASGLPLLTAVTGVGVTMAVMLLIARLASINSTTPMLAVMLGLAVGIDYALFILSRHRNQLGEGMTAEESTARAVGIAGSAVVFAGLTVFIALLGLGVSGIPFLTVMGAFAALAIVLAVFIALTMLPALMGLLADLNRDGTTIVMITHDLSLAARHASRTVTLTAPVPETAGPERSGDATTRGNGFDVRSKLVALTAAVTATFLTSNPLAHLGLAALTAGALVRVRGIRGLWGLLAPMVPVLALVFGFAAFTPGGIGYASVLVLRLVTMLCSTAALLATTPAERFTTLMRTLRLPNPLVFVCTTALRFIPTLRRRSRQITEAQQVRGAHIDSRGPVRRVLAHATIMVPLLTSGIRMSEDLSAAMISRGYGITRHPTRLHDLHWTWRDTLLTLASTALPLLAIAAG